LVEEEWWQVDNRMSDLGNEPQSILNIALLLIE
jgi:hypothetical protein